MKDKITMTCPREDCRYTWITRKDPATVRCCPLCKAYLSKYKKSNEKEEVNNVLLRPTDN